MRLPEVRSLRVLTAVFASTLLLSACSDSVEETPTGPASRPSFSLTSSGPQDFGAAIAAANKHTAALMTRPGVVGTGVGLNPAGQPVVKVFLSTGNVAGIPDQVDGVGVVPEVTGMFVARTDPTLKARPAPIGSSIGHPDVTAGTLGARVTDGGKVFILSNNHVLANGNAANAGDPTLQPGAYDGGIDPQDIIGTLYDFEPIKFNGGINTMDAAISWVTDPNDVSGSSPEPADGGYGAPGTATLTATLTSPAMQVQKYGRTTGHTLGEVTETNVTVSVCYETQGPFRCKKAATFAGQIGISDGSFSAGGDSGSLIVTADANKNLVGLLFAGSSTRTIANPIGPVLTRFGVDIDTTVPDPTVSDPPTLVSVSVTPTSASRTVGETQQFTATGHYSDASTANLTSTAVWSSSNTAVATIDAGSATAVGEGTTNITASYGGTTSDASLDVSAATLPPGDFSLTATGYKARGRQQVDLVWSGATSADVDVYRDGQLVGTTANDGSYTDNIGQRGGDSYTHQVCQAGESTCSNVTTVTF